MDRAEIFERIFGHCAHLAARIEAAVNSVSDHLHGVREDDRLRFVSHIADTEAFLSKVAKVAQCASIARRYASEPPTGMLRHAPAEYELLADMEQEAIASIVFQSLVRWRAFLKIVEMLGEACPPIKDHREYIGGVEAFEMLLGFDCIMSEVDPAIKVVAVDAFVTDALATLMDEVESVRDLTEADPRREAYIVQFGDDLRPLAEASWLYEKAIMDGRRYVALDLQYGTEPLERWLLEEKVKLWVPGLALSSYPERYRLLPKAIVGAAAQIFPWTPPTGEERTISEETASDPVIRRGARVLSMVHELHKAGYQRIRVLPFLSPSGVYWRGWITPADNVCGDGFNLIDEEIEHEVGLVAKYSSGQENGYFGWTDAKTSNARGLAKMFIERFPRIAAMGRGCDWAYAGWLTDVLGLAEQGELLSLIHEGFSDPDILRRWQPPPPLRALD